MEKVSRRTAIALTAGIPAALAGAASVAASATELDLLIEAHKLANIRWLAAADAEEELDRKLKRPEIYVPLSIGGGQSVHAHHSLRQAQCDLHKDIADRYKRETCRALGMLERVSPELGKQATAALRKAQATDLKAMRRLIREEAERQEASGVAAVVREYREASDAEHEALNAVMSFRCASLDELSKKAAYISNTLSGCYLDGEQAELLLASMMVNGAVS